MTFVINGIYSSYNFFISNTNFTICDYHHGWQMKNSPLPMNIPVELHQGGMWLAMHIKNVATVVPLVSHSSNYKPLYLTGGL